MSSRDHPFALCLTHDVDRPYKTWHHSLYYAIRMGDTDQLLSLGSDSNPYWQFDRIMDLEESLGVRSAFYFLSEPPLSSRTVTDLLDWNSWIQTPFRYDVSRDEMADAIRRLADGGWEVGLHGSYHSYDDRQRLAREKELVESVLGDAITGGRQHYLNLDVPRSWRHHRTVGLAYDSSLGRLGEPGFQHGYDVKRPFDDHFAVFPLTFMETDLPDPADSFSDAWAQCERLLVEAADNEAIMTVVWHPRFFSTAEFPGYARLYRRLVTAALEMDAWVGSPGEYYRAHLGDE